MTLVKMIRLILFRMIKLALGLLRWGVQQKKEIGLNSKYNTGK
jgi:hypothetical protein